MDKLETRKQSAKWPAIALSILLFFLTVVHNWKFTYEVQLMFGLGAAVFLLAALLSRQNRMSLRGTPDPISLILLLQSLLCFAGLFYGLSGKLALQQFALTGGGFFIFLFAYTYFQRDQRNLAALLGPLSLCLGLTGLMSIELATSRVLFPVLNGIGTLISVHVPSEYGAMEVNTRITSLLGNPNVFAPMVALSFLISLWLHQVSEGKKKPLYLANAFVCCTAFVLCFSMGSILMMGPALIALIAFAKKGKRLHLAILAGYVLLLSLLLASLTYMCRSLSVLPLVLVLLGSAGAALAYAKIPLPHASDRRVSPVKILVPVAVVIVAVIAASFVKGSYSLHNGDSFRRAVALDSGKHTLALTIDGAQDAAVNVEITSMDYTQAALKETSTLANATLTPQQGTMEFTVPNAAAAVFLKFSASSDAKITHASVSTADGGKTLALRYTLIPEFIVNRLQGYWVNDNAIQRFIFFRDGIRLGMKSPLLGFGGQSYAAAVFSVADYSYVTNHTHNQYIEAFTDGGVVGLALFVALAALCLIRLWKWRRQQPDSVLLPFLASCIVMIFLHCMIDVEFSYESYLLYSSVLLAALASASRTAAAAALPQAVKKVPVLPEEPDRKPADAPRTKAEAKAAQKAAAKAAQRAAAKASAAKSEAPQKSAPSGGYFGCVLALLAIALLLYGGRFTALRLISGNVTTHTLQAATVLDPCNSDDYWYSMANASLKNASLRQSYADEISRFVTRATQRPFHCDLGLLLAEYDFQLPTPDTANGLAMAEAYVHENRVDADHWDKVFLLYSEIFDQFSAKPDLEKKVAASALNLYQDLQKLNRTLPKEIDSRLANMLYLRAQSIAGGGDGLTLVDTRVLCDKNGDGNSDIVQAANGQTTFSTPVAFAADRTYTFRLYAAPAQKSQLHVISKDYPLTYNSALGCFETSIPSDSAVIADLTASVDTDSKDVYFTVTSAKTPG